MTTVLAISAVSAGLASALLTNRSVLWSRATKILASTSMVAIVIIGDPAINGYTVFISAGLVASWFGDLALSFKGTRAFLGGLVSLALAHALYTAGFFARSTMDVASVAFATFLTAAMAVLILRWLSPHVPVQLRIPESPSTS
ncbi:MAG: lysoplasmalogenase family protein [Actinomycetota bacterium]|nr:lysoplasmalogenase family protein [Actinomycetota bacterium]